MRQMDQHDRTLRGAAARRLRAQHWGMPALAVAVATALCAPAAVAAPGDHANRSSTATAGWDADAFRGHVDVVAGPDEDQSILDGAVFDDRNQNSTQDRNERGIAGAEVSNGLDVVTTDHQGRYEISVEDGQTVFVVQPAGYQVPVDEHNVAQFFYNHMPQGSPQMQYGGIAPTGELPDEVDFPLARTTDTLSRSQSCLFGADIQTADEKEVGYAEAGIFRDLAARTDYSSCGALFMGDNVDEDLSLYEDIKDLTAELNSTARFMVGNNDLDTDTDYDHRFDTYRQHFGPDHYSYDVGDLHVIALNTVQSSEGAPYDGRYNGGIDGAQMEWLRNDLERTPDDRLIVLATHIPLLSWADQGSDRHQVDQVREIHRLLEGREAVALAGHTHTVDIMEQGDSMAGWREIYGIDQLPFDHLIAPAIAGDGYSGFMTDNGYPLAVERDGTLPGVLTLNVRGTEWTERYTPLGGDAQDQMSLGLNTPQYRHWFRESTATGAVVTPFEGGGSVSRQDLEDTWLTANVFAGSTSSEVVVSIDGERATPAQRTQDMIGEGQRIGAENSDPSGTAARLAFAALTPPEVTGYGRSPVQAVSHLWRWQLPVDLAAGEHTAVVTTTDRHGRVFTEEHTFRVTD